MPGMQTPAAVALSIERSPLSLHPADQEAAEGSFF